MLLGAIAFVLSRRNGDGRDRRANRASLNRQRIIESTLSVLTAFFLTARAYAETPNSKQALCVLPVENVQMQAAKLIGVGEPDHVLDRLYVERGTMSLEEGSQGWQASVAVDAPIKVNVVINDLRHTGLSLKPGVTLGGVVRAEQEGGVRVWGIDRKGLHLSAGFAHIRGLPYRCEDLQLSDRRPPWSFSEGATLAKVDRLSSFPRGPSFAVEGMNAFLEVGRRDGKWIEIVHKEKGVFVVAGWTANPKFLKTGPNGGGPSNSNSGFETDACMPGEPVEVSLAYIDPETPVYASTTMSSPWTKFAGRKSVLVAFYAHGPVALTGLVGWKWPATRCEVGWVERRFVKPISLLADPKGSKHAN